MTTTNTLRRRKAAEYRLIARAEEMRARPHIDRKKRVKRRLGIDATWHVSCIVYTEETALHDGTHSLSTFVKKKTIFGRGVCVQRGIERRIMGQDFSEKKDAESGGHREEDVDYYGRPPSHSTCKRDH